MYILINILFESYKANKKELCILDEIFWFKIILQENIYDPQFI